MTVLTMTTYQMFLDSVEDELVDRRRVRPNCPRPEKLLTFQLVASRVFSTKKTFQFSTSQYHPPRKHPKPAMYSPPLKRSLNLIFWSSFEQPLTPPPIPDICHRHHRRCLCKFFLPSVIFSRLNAKTLHCVKI